MLLWYSETISDTATGRITLYCRHLWRITVRLWTSKMFLQTNFKIRKKYVE
jgi:hypothetical protein